MACQPEPLLYTRLIICYRRKFLSPECRNVTLPRSSLSKPNYTLITRRAPIPVPGKSYPEIRIKKIYIMAKPLRLLERPYNSKLVFRVLPPVTSEYQLTYLPLPPHLIISGHVQEYSRTVCEPFTSIPLFDSQLADKRPTSETTFIAE